MAVAVLALCLVADSASFVLMHSSGIISAATKERGDCTEGRRAMNSEDTSVVCEQGHLIAASDAFCRLCGAPAAGPRWRQTPEGIWQRQGDDGNWYVDRPDDDYENATLERLGRDSLRERLPTMVLGFAGGVVGFLGFFLNFFNHGGTSLSASSSGWFDLVPIFIGLSALALFLPKYGFVFSGLPLISLGITFGLRGLVAGSVAGHAGTSYGTGFWMIAGGSGVLAICWLLLIFTDLWANEA
jgi:hypothetical protein